MKGVPVSHARGGHATSTGSGPTNGVRSNGGLFLGKPEQPVTLFMTDCRACSGSWRLAPRAAAEF
jgi:hypothetical protein